MKYLLKKPHIIFLVSIPVLLLFGQLNRDTTLSFNMYDTYYVFAVAQLTALVAILFGAIGLGYWMMLRSKKDLSPRLNNWHIGLTFGGGALFLVLTLLYREGFNGNEYLRLIKYILGLLVILGQILFPINIFSSLIVKRNKTNG